MKVVNPDIYLICLIDKFVLDDRFSRGDWNEKYRESILKTGYKLNSMSYLLKCIILNKIGTNQYIEIKYDINNKRTVSKYQR